MDIDRVIKCLLVQQIHKGPAKRPHARRGHIIWIIYIYIYIYICIIVPTTCLVLVDRLPVQSKPKHSPPMRSQGRKEHRNFIKSVLLSQQVVL